MYTPPFDITPEILALVADISEHLGALGFKSGVRVPEPMLRKENQIKTIHSSLAIEHNSLTLEQMTAIINGKHVIGAPDEIQEVKNAIQAYRLMSELDAYKEEDLLKAHALMTQDLVKTPGQWRTQGVGVFAGEKCLHMAPPAAMVPELMRNLFQWVSSTDIHPLIASCVFHYEFEFIHPFEDGNGRMGRYWQTMLLSRWKAIFAWLPVETIVRKNQQEYYDAIAKSDSEGKCTAFIVLMLHCIKLSLEQETTNIITNKTEDKVIGLIRKNPQITIAGLCTKTGLSESGIKKVLKGLRDKNLLYREGSNKTGRWVIGD